MVTSALTMFSADNYSPVTLKTLFIKKKKKPLSYFRLIECMCSAEIHQYSQRQKPYHRLALHILLDKAELRRG